MKGRAHDSVGFYTPMDIAPGESSKSSQRPLRPCGWHDCKNTLINISELCQEHYLLKEARYAVYDLEHDEHYATEKDKEFVQRMAVERLIKYAKYKLGN